jgi:two-component system cell cycle sensor histidine kinase PleC
MENKLLFIVVVLQFLLLAALCSILIISRKRSALDSKLLKEKLRAALETTDRKTVSFYDMVHEMKTPLSVIMGAVQLLETKAKEKNLEIIKINCCRLMRLTNNLLDLARIEAGCQVLKPVNCKLDSLIDEIVRSVKPYALQKQLDLSYAGASGEITAAVDIEKIERVMLNLISNAIKFTKPGGAVRVSSRRLGDSVVISVKDTGIGIPEDSLDTIFNRYKQADRSAAEEREGSGLGLSIVKSFIDLHQGNIKVVSEAGRGSEFIIELPIRRQDTAAEEAEAGGPGTRISDAAKIEFSSIRSIST